MSRFQTLQPSSLDRDAFVAAFADIYEHSPWVAEQAYDKGVDETLDEIEVLHQRMSDV
ncbi:2-oxo-4-hydroxy-4-carboxy-5-ureidoimidazoline decarboxylase, partial [Photobacterium damselae]